jgi:hypothetical protein
LPPHYYKYSTIFASTSITVTFLSEPHPGYLDRVTVHIRFHPGLSRSLPIYHKGTYCTTFRNHSDKISDDQNSYPLRCKNERPRISSVPSSGREVAVTLTKTIEFDVEHHLRPRYHRERETKRVGLIHPNLRKRSNPSGRPASDETRFGICVSQKLEAMEGTLYIIYCYFWGYPDPDWSNLWHKFWEPWHDYNRMPSASDASETTSDARHSQRMIQYISLNGYTHVSAGLTHPLAS